jgi:uncharacterized protein
MARRSVQSPFVIPTRDIPVEGLERTFDLSAELAPRVFAESSEVKAGPDVRGTVMVTRNGSDYIAGGELRGSAEMACSRCLKPVTVKLDSEWGMTFVPAHKLSPEKEDEREVAEDQVDVAPYEDEELDLEPTLREELLLALPVAPICADTCRGLCARCGHDLNQGDCACPPEPKDDRWAALRQMKLQ